MRVSKQFSYAICVASIGALSAPSVAFSHDHEYRLHSNQPMATQGYDQNFAPTEFFSQGERDLVARVKDHLAADSVLAPQVKNLAIDVEVGTITLRGSLPTRADEKRAVSIVEGVLGVERVNDEIRVTNAAAVSPSAATMQSSQSEDYRSTTHTRAVSRSTLVTPERERPVASIPPTGSRGVAALDDRALPGSGQMAEEDRTGSSGPSGTQSTLPSNTGAIDPVGRVAKPAGDYAVTAVDRALASQVRLALNGNPNFTVTEENVHLVVDNGFVTLQGWASNERERVAIAERVKEITGVQGVDNQLRVRPNANLRGAR